LSDYHPMLIHVIGYGNPGRRDDGLGVALAAEIESLALHGVTADSDYQLNVEYSADICSVDVVVFADASVNAPEPFEFTRIQPAREITFTTHSVSPASVLAVCQDIYGRCPEAYQLAVRGYSFELGEGLTEEAMGNLRRAVEFLSGFITEKLQSIP